MTMPPALLSAVFGGKINNYWPESDGSITVQYLWEVLLYGLIVWGYGILWNSIAGGLA
jgi:hypothetical protein